jgi:hypothetical protein
MMTAGAAFAAVPLIGAGTAEPGWEKLPTEAYPGKRDDISFADPLHGWYGTGKGDLFRTTDGGASWAKVASKPGTFGYRKFNRPFLRVWRVGSGRASAALGTDRAQIGGSCVGFRHRGATQRLNHGAGCNRNAPRSETLWMTDFSPNTPVSLPPAPCALRWRCVAGMGGWRACPGPGAWKGGR